MYKWVFSDTRLGQPQVSGSQFVTTRRPLFTSTASSEHGDRCAGHGLPSAISAIGRTCWPTPVLTADLSGEVLNVHGAYGPCWLRLGPPPARAVADGHRESPACLRPTPDEAHWAAARPLRVRLPLAGAGWSGSGDGSGVTEISRRPRQHLHYSFKKWRIARRTSEPTRYSAVCATCCGLESVGAEPPTAASRAAAGATDGDARPSHSGGCPRWELTLPPWTRRVGSALGIHGIDEASSLPLMESARPRWCDPGTRGARVAVIRRKSTWPTSPARGSRPAWRSERHPWPWPTLRSSLRLQAARRSVR